MWQGVHLIVLYVYFIKGTDSRRLLGAARTVSICGYGLSMSFLNYDGDKMNIIIAEILSIWLMVGVPMGCEVFK
jgi:hypothetical protein